MDQERRSQREMMQENEKQARTTYTNAQAKAAMSRRDNKASKLRVELTDPRKSNYFYEEALKTLRTNIQFAGADIKTILVTSCFPNEGKSDVAFQLAREMGMVGKKTVFVEVPVFLTCPFLELWNVFVQFVFYALFTYEESAILFLDLRFLRMLFI